MTQYQVTAVWWPDGWEPLGPLDVPNCLFESAAPPHSPPAMTYDRAVATVGALNRQAMDRPGSAWYVVTRAEPVADLSLRVVHTEGSSRGDCSHCPAHAFPCASE